MTQEYCINSQRIVARLFFFWGMLYAPPLSFESCIANTTGAQSIRECMRAYGELRALTVGVYSDNEAIAYGSRVALMCCSLARYVQSLKTCVDATCSCEDLFYIARLVDITQQECLSWNPADARLRVIKHFASKMLSQTETVLGTLIDERS